MSKPNQNLEDTQNSQNQNRNMSEDDLRDGNRNSKNLRGEGSGPGRRPGTEDQGKEAIDQFGRRGSKQD